MQWFKIYRCTVQYYTQCTLYGVRGTYFLIGLSRHRLFAKRKVNAARQQKEATQLPARQIFFRSNLRRIL